MKKFMLISMKISLNNLNKVLLLSQQVYLIPTHSSDDNVAETFLLVYKWFNCKDKK